jgi:hypothetical protein
MTQAVFSLALGQAGGDYKNPWSRVPKGKTDDSREVK